MTTVTGAITRTELSLGDLTIISGGVYDIRVNTFDPGTVVPRYEWAASDWAHGAVDTSGGALDNPTITAVWRIRGTSHSDLNTKVAALVAALRQSTFNLTLSFDSQDSKWKCYRAQLTHPYTSARQRAYVGEMTSLIPRHPIPVSGPF